MSQFSSFGFTEGLEGIGTLKERLVEVNYRFKFGVFCSFRSMPCFDRPFGVDLLYLQREVIVFHCRKHVKKPTYCPERLKHSGGRLRVAPAKSRSVLYGFQRVIAGCG